MEEELLVYIRKIVNIEKKYYFSEIDRNFIDELKTLVTNIIFLCLKLKKNNLIINYKIYVWLCLEKLKQKILLEDKLIEIFQKEISNFYKTLETCNIKINTKNEIFDKFYTNNEEKNETKLQNRRNNYPKKVTKFFKKWLSKNLHNPYPSELEKNYFSEKTGLDINQINNWFVNARRRIISKHFKYKNLG